MPAEHESFKAKRLTPLHNKDLLFIQRFRILSGENTVKPNKTLNEEDKHILILIHWKFFSATTKEFWILFKFKRFQADQLRTALLAKGDFFHYRQH